MLMDRYNVTTLTEPLNLRAALLDDVRAGFARRPRMLPPKYFYDVDGSGIFERITDLPEYYVTRAEASALELAVASLGPSHSWDTLVELGSGSSKKTRLLLDRLVTGPRPTYVPVEISPSALEGAAVGLLQDYDDLRVEGFVVDFLTPELAQIFERPERKLVAFLGSTLGNLTDAERQTLLQRMASGMDSGDALLIGVDLIKDPSRLEAAYNDSEGVTAEFNLNVLKVLQRELGASLDVGDFRHHAPYVSEQSRIEMRLYAQRDLQLTFDERCGLPVYTFSQGDYLLTELSVKFDRPSIDRIAASSGLAIRGFWADPAEDVAVVLLVPSPT